MTAPPSRFDGAVILVTGGAGALGHSTAQLLSQQGARLALVDLDADRVTTAAAELPGEAIGIAADVTQEEQVVAAVAEAAAHFGRIDGHHLSAGIFGSLDPVTSLSVADFDACMAVNVRGTFLGLKHALRQFARQGSGGAVTVVSSSAGIRGSDDLFAYQTAKHAVIGMMRSAAMYGAARGVRVNAIAPGTVPTALFAATSGTEDAIRRSGTTPMRRAGRPEEIASVVAFLLSEESSYVNGEVISIDGGAKTVNVYRPIGGAGLWTPPPLTPDSVKEGQPV